MAEVKLLAPILGAVATATEVASSVSIAVSPLSAIPTFDDVLEWKYNDSLVEDALLDVVAFHVCFHNPAS